MSNTICKKSEMSPRGHNQSFYNDLGGGARAPLASGQLMLSMWYLNGALSICFKNSHKKAPLLSSDPITFLLPFALDARLYESLPWHIIHSLSSNVLEFILNWTFPTIIITASKFTSSVDNIYNYPNVNVLHNLFATYFFKGIMFYNLRLEYA